jgi:dTDP-4-dehydrorhamnose reductase
MRLLIAGWHGQVARALIEAAPSSPHVKALAAGRPALDVRDPRSVERAFGDLSPNIVINTAAYTAVDQAESDPEAAFALNQEGARVLARAAARRNIPVIHLSTHYVFDGAKQGPYSESDGPCPATVYGRSKLEGERAVAEENPSHVIIRTGWVFSASGRNFVSKILGSAASGEPLRVVADQHGNPTYAPHLATAILEVARQLTQRTSESAAGWGLYHAAGAGITSWHGFAREILDSSAKRGREMASVEPISTADYPTPAPRPSNSSLDCARFERAFGLALPSWQDGVDVCVARLLSA